jgi:hypothetical protein
MHQQLWGYKVEWKSVSRGTGGKRLNTTALDSSAIETGYTNVVRLIIIIIIILIPPAFYCDRLVVRLSLLGPNLT